MNYNLLLYVLIFIILLFMVLKENNINQSILITSNTSSQSMKSPTSKKISSTTPFLPLNISFSTFIASTTHNTVSFSILSPTPTLISQIRPWKLDNISSLS